MPAREPSSHHSVLCAGTAPLVPVILLKTSYAADRSPHTQLKAVWVILTCTLGMTRERPRPLMAPEEDGLAQAARYAEAQRHDAPHQAARRDHPDAVPVVPCAPAQPLDVRLASVCSGQVCCQSLLRGCSGDGSGERRWTQALCCRHGNFYHIYTCISFPPHTGLRCAVRCLSWLGAHPARLPLASTQLAPAPSQA